MTHGSSHAGYYPGALPLAIKAFFDPASGRLYGAQVVGYDDVDKSIDVPAEAVRRGASVTEFVEKGEGKEAVVGGAAREGLVDGVEIGGVATYMEAASQANVNLFI